MEAGDVVKYTESGIDYQATVLKVRVLDYHMGANNEPLLDLRYERKVLDANKKPTGKMESQVRYDVAHATHALSQETRNAYAQKFRNASPLPETYPGGRWEELPTLAPLPADQQPKVFKDGQWVAPEPKKKFVDGKWVNVLLAFVLLLCAGRSFGQSLPPGDAQSLVGGTYYAAQYSYWNDAISTGVAAGSPTITVNWSSVILADGREVLPFSNSSGIFPAITVGAGSTQETVTPTSVSGCNVRGRGAASFQTCTITVSGNFTNAHGQGELVTSGDFGIVEAINDAAASGGGPVNWMVDTGVVTLNTGALTTTTAFKVPSQFYTQGSAARVTTTITTSTNWAVGISGSTSAFAAVNTGLTAGTTALAVVNAPALVGTTLSMTPLLVTVTGANAGAGAVHLRVWGTTAVQPSF